MKHWKLYIFSPLFTAPSDCACETGALLYRPHLGWKKKTKNTWLASWGEHLVPHCDITKSWNYRTVIQDYSCIWWIFLISGEFTNILVVIKSGDVIYCIFFFCLLWDHDLLYYSLFYIVCLKPCMPL